MIPRDIRELGVKVSFKMDEALLDADVVMMLRIQTEREKQSIFPSLREYSTFYGLNKENIKKAKEDVLVMHPGPVNRGVEISPEIADGSHSVIMEQVTNGVAVRMALLYLLTGAAA
jgi:aspartate carbamoyltransferase catalytic subunit